MKIGDGISENATNFTVKLYKDSYKKNEYTYINNGYIDDVPILDETETMVKLEVAGFIGWMEKEDSQGINILKVPINQAKNLSYYQNENGQLIHYISANVEGNTVAKEV